MFGIDSAELLIIALVALVVIGPKDLPRVMRTVGHFVGRARGMARHFRTGLDTMIREAELEEMEKKWKSENERIMREHPLPTQDRPDESADSDWGKLPAEVKASPTPPAPPAPPAPRSKAPPIPGPAPATPPPGERP